MDLEEDARPRGIFKFKSVSLIFQACMGTDLPHCATLLLSVKLASGMGFWAPWTKQAVGFIQFGGFHVTL